MAKRLTCKPLDPKKVKIIGIIFAVSFFIFPSVRYNTGAAFHTVGDLIQRTSR
jgi:hypothetical protein